MITLFGWLFVIALPWVWLWTKFVNPSFSMIDDPLQLRIFQSMASDFGQWWDTSGFRGEAEDGRLRPVFWLSRFCFYYMPCKLDPTCWHTVHYLKLVVVLTAVFFLLKLLSKKNWVSILGCALWIFNPKTMENFTRFGTSEVWQILWLSLGMLIFPALFRYHTRRTRFLLWILLSVLTFLFYFSKETSVLLSGFALAGWLGSLALKKSSRAWGIFLILNAFMLVLQRYCSPPIAGYSSSFDFSYAVILDNFIRYMSRVQWLYLLAALLLSFLARLIYQQTIKGAGLREKNTDLWQLAFLVLGIHFLISLLPWTQPTPRYLVITDLFFALFIALEIGTICGAFFEKSKALPFGKRLRMAAAGTAVFLFMGTCLSLAYASQAQLYSELRYAYLTAGHPTAPQALEWLARNAKKNARVLYLYLENELVRNTAIYLRDFYGREDMILYNASKFATQYQKMAYPIVPVAPADWPHILDQIDYIYWNHRGIRKLKIDLLHMRLMKEISETKYAAGLEKIYGKLCLSLSPLFPDGTEIWRLDHEKIEAIQKNKTQETRP